MSPGHEQDQLFADASTLLMFASAAARQRLPPQQQAGEPILRDPGPYQRPLNPENLPNQHPKMSDTNSQSPLVAHDNTLSQMPPLLRPSRTLPAYGPSGFQGAPQSALMPPQMAAQSVLPPLKPLAMARAPPTGIDARLLGPAAFAYTPHAPPNIRTVPPLLPQTSTHASTQMAGVQPDQKTRSVGYGYYGLDHATLMTPGTLPPMYGAGIPTPHLASTKLPARRPSHGQSANTAFEITTSAHTQPAHRASLPRQGSLSPHTALSDAHELPISGNFTAPHRRTPSNQSTKRASVASPTASPGVAAGHYARGINVELGKRSTDNAIIAAAALAAAADIPFPLRDKSTSTRRPELSVDTSTRAASASALVRGPDSSPHEGQCGKRMVKLEEPVPTETEDDDNKTEDEPASLAVRETFDSGELPPAVAGATLPGIKIEQKNGCNKATSESISAKPETAQPNKVASLLTVLSIPKTHTFPTIPPSTSTTVPSSTASSVNPPVPPLAEYKVDPDAGTIGCICGIEEDDGFTIQCDICFRWQHCLCMGYLTSDAVPEDEYKCYYCDELKWNKIDPEKCRAATAARLEAEKVNEVPQKPTPPKRKTLSSGNDDKKRRRLEKDVRVSEKPLLEKRKSLNADSPILKPAVISDFQNKENPLLEDGATAEQYQGVYFRLKENDFKTPGIKSLIADVGARSEKLARTSNFYETMSLSQYKLLKFSKVNLPNHQKYLQERNELRRNKGVNKTTVRVKTYSENPKQKFVSVMKTGLFITENSVSSAGEAVIPAGSVIIEYLGEIDLWELYVNNKINQYSLWGTLKPKVAKVRVPSSENDALELIVDSRFVGNEARFIRRSCAMSANCEIRPVYIPLLQTFKFLVVTIHPILLKGDSLEEELRLPWDWDPLHPINEMFKLTEKGDWEEGKRLEDFVEQDKAYLISCVDTILNFVECACNTSNYSNQCAIFKIKKATSYLLRSNRKTSSLGGSGQNKSKEELVLPKKPKDYVSWGQRLIQRDYALLEGSPYAESEIIYQDLPLSGRESPSLNAIDLESEHTEHTDTQIKSKLLRHTPKKILLEQAREICLTNYNVSSQTIDSSSLPVDEMPSKELGIPLTDEVLTKIKKQVNEFFQPYQKVQPIVNILTDVKKVKVEDLSKDTLTAAKEILPDIPAEKSSLIDIKPPVVKKLSFADYKKKKR